MASGMINSAAWELPALGIVGVVGGLVIEPVGAVVLVIWARMISVGVGQNPLGWTVVGTAVGGTVGGTVGGIVGMAVGGIVGTWVGKMVGTAALVFCVTFCCSNCSAISMVAPMSKMINPTISNCNSDFLVGSFGDKLLLVVATLIMLKYTIYHLKY